LAGKRGRGPPPGVTYNRGAFRRHRLTARTRPFQGRNRSSILRGGISSIRVCEISGIERADLERRVADVPFWWHSIDLGGGVITPGFKPLDVLRQELGYLQLPDLRGLSVLDIGCWDGYFAFAAERLGAKRVVALDHYMWSIDTERWLAYRRDREQSGLPIEQYESVPELWQPDRLPGKKGFDVAHEALRSDVEVVVGDFLDIDLDTLGTCDVVLYLGVLYHVRHPLLALERLAKVTRGMALIETQAQEWKVPKRHAMCRFFEGDELSGDPSNWWIPNERALLAMCRAAGFPRVEMIRGAQRRPRAARGARAHALLPPASLYRAYLRAVK
jgi:tRNA (mo5U34)-methyltransferase